MNQVDKNKTIDNEYVSDKIITIPNIVSFARLCLVGVFLALLLNGFNLAATVVFAVAACTDFVDGQIARRTQSVSRLGQLLDPAVDRALMIVGVIGLLLVGRLPLWIIIIVVARDVFVLAGGAWLVARHRIRIPVVYAGKVATTLLFIGFAGLLLNWPLLSGLGVCAYSWLPGFNYQAVSWGIWFIYAGLVLSFVTTLYYGASAFRALRKKDTIRGIQDTAHCSRDEVLK